MNGAPDWQDGECCFRCRTQFTLVARKHHCRNCGNIFCAKCSSQQIPLPKLNIEKNVRVCDTCYEKIASKNEDPLTLALNSSDREQSKTAKSSSHSKSSSGSKQTTNTASAPSEQELKEEEEFQLALALSLSEAPTKVSFPDCRHYEASTSNQAPTASQTNKHSTSDIPSTVTAKPSNAIQSNTNGTSPQRVSTQVETAVPPSTSVEQYAALNTSASVSQNPIPVQQQIQYQLPQPIQTPQIDYQISSRDLEVFRYVGEVQSTLEIFNNRLESCKLRNRPVANDTAIQSLFLKLSAEFQPKLTEFIRTYEEERANHERLQDKLSQIADARAALDALREEHQEKVRQQAAEAERQRQSQLATKLEAMRQKKSQMMQYQRELALQRICEQEVQQQPMNQPGYQAPTGIVQSHLMSSQTAFDPMLQMHDPSNSGTNNQQPPTTLHQDWNRTAINQQYTGTQVNYVPNQEQQLPTSQLTSQLPRWTPFSQQATPLPTQSSQQQFSPYLPSFPSQITTTQVPQVSTQPQAQQPQSAIDRASIVQLERQYLPDSKPEEDAPLISFDD